MNAGFEFGDILLFAAIAAFILLRYRSMLGEKTGKDPKELEREREERKARALLEMERVIKLPQKPSDTKPSPEMPQKNAAHDAYEGALRDTLEKAQKIDAEFNADDFLEGARQAFEMVIDAYSKRDHETLKMLLSKPLYAKFSDALSQAEKENRLPHNTLVAITQSQLKDASITGSQATMTVEFISDQIQLVRNQAGDIIEGNPSEEIEVEDRWVFVRDLRSASPNWTIIET